MAIGWWSRGDGATARLQRLEDGLATRTDTRELTPGHVVTLWWVVFNNPDECASSPCGLGLVQRPAPRRS